MYTITHYEEKDVLIARLSSVVRNGNTVYILSTHNKDFLIPVQHLNDASLIALTKLEVGSCAKLSYSLTYKTPDDGTPRIMRVYQVKVLSDDTARKAA